MRGRTGLGVCLGTVVLAFSSSAGDARAADDNEARLRTELTGQQRDALRRAVTGAARRLERASCRRIFQDFTDASGRLLEESLEAAGRSGPGLLQDWIFFADGRQEKRCGDGRVLAFTQTGSRAVWICGRRFSQERWRDPAWTELVLIHEALHVLGLGEDPPSSEAISRRVLDRCGG